MSGGTWQSWVGPVLAILGLAVITLITRAFFMIPERELPLPDWLRRGLKYAPLAALAGVIAPEVLMSGGELVRTLADARLPAVLLAAGAGRRMGHLPKSLLRRDGGVQWVRAQGQPIHMGEPQAGTVWILEDCSATRDARQQPAWKGAHDALTLLPHRAAFVQRLHALLASRAAQARAPLPGAPLPAPGLYGEEGSGVLMHLDLDHFAVINDLAGHDAGDDVLRHLARLLESEVRQMGWAARLGGDEFAVVLPGATPARGQAVAEQLRAAVQAWEPSYGGRSYTLGLSIGLVPLPAGLRDVAPLLHAADMACYAAKRAGRNRVEVRRVSPQPLAEGQAP